MSTPFEQLTDSVAVDDETIKRGASNDSAVRPVADALIVFTPSGRRARVAIGTPVLDAARALGVDLDSVCGGRGLCGRCQIVPGRGEFAKHGLVSAPDHLDAQTKAEARWQRINGELEGERRLGCQARILGDLVIDVPPDSQVHRQLVRKEASALDLVLAPAVRLYVVDVREPDMHEPSGDLRRLRDALAAEHGLTGLGVALPVLRDLQRTLRRESWRVTVAVHRGADILAVYPGFKARVAGLAVDVGSTTIAAHLCDLGSGEVLASAGVMNPQIRFGEDLMSRVSYVMMNPGGDLEMTRSVREAIDALLGEVCYAAQVERDEVLDAVFVANPVMHHLLLGIDPVELGGAPFALACDESLDITLADLGIGAHPAARAWLLPCVAGHVGADTAGMVLAEAPDAYEGVSLLVDVGTNAEIVLGNRSRLLACSSPTGPAFEGAQISGGQRAAPGAIERVRIDRDTLEPRFRVIGSETWSDSPDFARDTAATGVTGICGSGIIEVVAELFLAGIVDSDGVIRGECAERNPRVVADGRTYAYVLHEIAGKATDGAGDAVVAGNAGRKVDDERPGRAARAGSEVRGTTIRITQTDIRQIQLAKAALYAGVRLLMDRFGVDHVDRIRLAGAFGSHIDPIYAMVLGLIPDCVPDAVGSAGNAAGDGARIALLDVGARARIDAQVRRIEKVETAVEADFQAHFVDAMAFPHKHAPFPELGKVVTLPDNPRGGNAQSAGTAAGAARRRRREARRGA